MYQTNMYEGMLAETVMHPGPNGELINAYMARPLGSGPFPAMVTCWQPPMLLLFLARAAFLVSRLLFVRSRSAFLFSRKLSAFSVSFSARISASVDSVQSCTGTEKLSPSLAFPASSFVNPKVPNPS